MSTRVVSQPRAAIVAVVLLGSRKHAANSPRPMPTESPDIHCLLDRRWLQTLQDEVSRSAGITVGILDAEHRSFTEESGGGALCRLIRSSEIGRSRCEQQETQGAERAKAAALAGEPGVTYVCHAGLVHCVAAIIVDGHHVGTVSGGQVFGHPPEAPTLDRLRHLAGSIGLSEQADDFTEVAQHTQVLSSDRIRSATSLIQLTAQSLSQMAYQRWQADRQSQVRQTLLVCGGNARLEGLLKTAVEELRVAVGAEHAAVFLKDSRGVFMARALERPLAEANPNLGYEPWEGLTGYVGATGMTLRVQDVRNVHELSQVNPNLRWVGKIQQGPPAQFLAVALKNEGGGVVGVLRFSNQALGVPFGEADEWLATAYAQALSQALEQAAWAPETTLAEEQAYDRYLEGLKGG
jgi:ligand-binding sensor protein